MNNQQYVWIAIIIVGIVGGVEIGYAVSNFHNSYRIHHHFLNSFDGWHHSGYMIQNPDFRQQMYSSMFDSTKYREEMSQYLAEHPSVLQSWCDTMMNNPNAMRTMHNMMGGMMGHGMMMGNMSGMGDMSHHNATGDMGSMSGMTTMKP